MFVDANLAGQVHKMFQWDMQQSIAATANDVNMPLGTLLASLQYFFFEQI